MKKIVVFVSALMFVACGKSGSGDFTISGTAKGIEDGKMVVLQKSDDANFTMIPIDTVKVKDGKFEFTGEVEESEMYSVIFPELNGGFSVVAEKGDIKAEVYKDSIMATKVSGTPSNDDLFKLNSDLKKIQKKMMKREADYVTLHKAEFEAAKAKNDSAVMMKLSGELQEIRSGKEYNNAIEKFITSNPKSYMSVLIVKEMANAPMNVDFVKVKKLYEGLDSSVKELKPGLNIKKQIDAYDAAQAKKGKELKKGDKVPDFSAATPEGKTVSLQQALGKATIIDFWASWCGPCRQENPNVVALYNELHAKGLNIIGVSLDDEKADWVNAIKKDQLTWTHVSNLKKWDDPIARMYHVEQIPTTFLVDAQGKLVAKDLRGDALKQAVLELLKN